MSSDSTSPIAGDTTHSPRRRSPDVVRRNRTLAGFVEAVSQADGIELIDVDALTTLVVRTYNSVYRITILTPHRREVAVQGGRFFPEHTRACLDGSSGGGSCLKLGWIGVGLHLEFHAGDQWIITSHVRTIAVEPSATGAVTSLFDVTPYAGPALGDRRIAVAPDGQRFLLRKDATGQTDTDDAAVSEINVVLDWTQELLERVPWP